MSDFIKLLEDRTETLIEKIKGNIVTAGLNATVKTAQGIGYEIVKDGENLSLKITANAFTQVLETGRKPTPGKPPSRSMIENITEWAIARGLMDFSDRSMVWAIAVGIQNEGTKTWQTGGRTDIYTMPFEEFIKTLGQDILGMITDDFIKTTLKTWQQVR